MTQPLARVIGHARIALVEYLSGYVLPLVRRQHDQEAVRLKLYEAAAEQAYLVGWMAYDDGHHGLAQRYLIQALAWLAPPRTRYSVPTCLLACRTRPTSWATPRKHSL